MSCPICTSTPAIPEGRQNVFCNTSHPYILNKISEIIVRNGFQVEVEKSFLCIQADDFPSLIQAMAGNDSLSNIEKRNIYILPLALEEQLNFGYFTAARTLESWSIMMHAQDLIWILKNGAITIQFQPIIHLESRQIYAYECLARGVLQDGSIMPPGIMFDAASKTGMLYNLDRQCREKAIKTAAQHEISKNIFINFLPSSIYNPEFCLRDTVSWARQLNFDPAKIVFEVVESDRIDDLQHLKNILSYYKDRGFRTALDDVGSGYSSLNLLTSINPDIIKIDMKIVRGIESDITKQAIARALVNIAKDSSCQILAEGIETVSELEWFKKAGVDMAQGYFFGRPAPKPLEYLPDEISRFL